MKRIAILAPYVGIVNRGAETFVIELTKKLSKKYEIDVFTLSDKSGLESNFRKIIAKKGIIFKIHKKLYNRFKYYRKIINKFYFLIPDVIFQHKFSKEAFKVINKERYDILFPNNGIWGAKYSASYRKKNKIPYIYTGHGGIGTGEKYIIQSKPDAYICLTHKQLMWAEEIKDNEKVKTKIIPNGVNVSEFGHSDELNKRKIILSVAALTEFKRHILTIKAVSMLSDVELIILGKGEDEIELRKIAEKLLPGRYVITATSYDNVKNYYSKADLFVLPSREEPFGIVYLEAMASNVPIVAPDDSQRREIIDNAGLYCNVENISEYAGTIKEALETDWGDKPLQRAKRFDWELIAKEYIELIEEVI